MDTKSVKEDMERFENLIKMINFEYNQFFAGNKQHPPKIYEREINKLINKYNLNQITNTTLRFKFNNLIARYITFRDKWQKKLREIEDSRVSTPTGTANKSSAPFYQNELDKIPDKYDKSKVVDIIESKIQNYRSKGFENVDVNIRLDDGKLKLKVKPKS